MALRLGEQDLIIRADYPVQMEWGTSSVAPDASGTVMPERGEGQPSCLSSLSFDAIALRQD